MYKAPNVSIVDGEKLLDALMYDRNQYNKGYFDGLKNATAALTNRWIPVTEKLPNENEYVLAWSKYGILEAAFWNGHKWFTTWDYDELLEVTHWMPQPKPPIDNMPDSKRYRYFGR